MAYLALKPNQAKALAQIAEMPIEQFVTVADKLCAIERPSIRVSTLFESLNSIIHDETTAKALSSQLVSLATYARVMQASSEDVVESLLEGIRRDELLTSNLPWYEGVHGEFAALLSCEAVTLPSKALHLSTDHNEVYRTGNVVTDVRPVFNSRDEVVGSVVLQTLKIHYLEDGGQTFDKEVSLALDSDDIEKLIGELRRAQKKALKVQKWVTKNSETEAFVVGEETYGFA